jgi:hypothetical protein
MSENPFHARDLCLDQASSLLDAAEHLDSARLWPYLVYHLALLALEEVGKAACSQPKR